MSNSRSVQKLKLAAVKAALASGAVLMKYFRKPLKVKEKLGAGLVTNADIESEAAALKILRRAAPGFDIYAEESSPQARKLEREGQWIIDPLDGTTNFVHGFPMFCVSIAARVGDELEVGVIYHPILKDLYVGVRGAGATVNRKPLRVSNRKHLSEGLLTTGFSVSRGERLHRAIEVFETVSNEARAVRRPGSAALDLAYTARGIFDGFWEADLAAWDVAAGAVLVREAGGLVTDYAGNPFLSDARQILAANRYLHPKLARLLGPV